MDKASVADERERAVRDSTRAVRADRSLCRQIVAVLFTDEEPIEQAFLGEPVLEVMGMFVWALDKETEEPDRFDPAIALPAWARKRGRGAWRAQEPTPAERIQYGSSDEQYAEIEAALQTNGHSTIRCETTSYEDCADCHARRRRTELWEVQQEHVDNSPGLIPGELLCDGCSVRHGIR